MIKFSVLAERLKTKIELVNQTLGTGLNFNVVSDTGEYKKPDRVGNEVTDYINCLLSLTSSDISNLTDGTVIATQTARLDVIVRMPDVAADEVYNNEELETVAMKIEQVRAVLSNLTQSSEFVSIKENSDDESSPEYSVSIIYQNAVSGERNIVANIGDSFTFSVYIYYILIQGGINTKSLVFNLDGTILPYQAVSVIKSKTYDSNVFSNTLDGSVKNTAIQSNWSATFELPAIKGDFWDMIFEILTGADKLNTAHVLSFKVGSKINNYLVNIGEVTLNGETVKNAGLKVSFFESDDNFYLLDFAGNYEKIYENTTQNPITVNISVVGDGTGFYFIESDQIKVKTVITNEIIQWQGVKVLAGQSLWVSKNVQKQEK
jgi:hypothetical protein